MQIKGKCVVVTGGANGIGRGLAERFIAEGANAVVIVDIQGDAAQATATAIGAHAVTCDVGDHAALDAMIDRVEREIAPIDLFCANAAVFGGDDLTTTDDFWDRAMRVNVMSHVWTAQRLAPRMAARGGGHFLFTLSATALITGPSGLVYTVTKHGGLGFAEWLALNHGHEGIGVSCLCPTLVATRTALSGGGSTSALAMYPGAAQTPEEVAGIVVDALAADKFLILPNPKVARTFQRKAEDYDGWIAFNRDRVVQARAPR